MLKVKSLKPGNKIALIAPAGILRDKDKVFEAIDHIQNRGYQVKLGKNVFKDNDYLAGSDDERLQDLIESFEDKDIDAIFCLRGGYGTMRLLDKIDYNSIKNNPKIFLGYSDITALHLAFYKFCDMPTFHGPLAASDFTKEGFEEFTSQNLWKIIENTIDYPLTIANGNQYQCLEKGNVSGQLIGGNLSILCSLLGTSYLPDLSDKILFIEDIGENIYRIDRLLTQLKLSGILQSVKGCIFGDFSNITDSNGKLVDENKIFSLIQDTMKNITIPAILGFSRGHERKKSTLIIGSECEFNATKGTVIIVKPFLT